MSAMPISQIESQTKTTTIPKEAVDHIQLLSELLREINLEKRMETVMKTDGLIKHWGNGGIQSLSELESIRTDLEEEFKQLRLMIFMVEQAQYFIEVSE